MILSVLVVPERFFHLWMVPLRMTLESKVPSEKCCQIGNLPQIGFLKKIVQTTTSSSIWGSPCSAFKNSPSSWHPARSRWLPTCIWDESLNWPQGSTKSPVTGGPEGVLFIWTIYYCERWCAQPLGCTRHATRGSLEVTMLGGMGGQTLG